ncbi:MATE family efflux transporter [Cryomorphaceae bacterium]|nr:MATE family efflux transporter [Cryomorphaceae bacterium]
MKIVPKNESRRSDDLGVLPIPKLLLQQSIPASIGFLVMSIYNIVDTIFVGRYVGSEGIGAITVVLPISFLISSIGMAIGIGGSSIISRALGARQLDRANLAFGNMISAVFVLGAVFVLLGVLYADPILSTFGAKGGIFPYAQRYFMIILYGLPALIIAMMANNVMRAEGRPKAAMYVLVIPAVVNLILDPIMIVWLDLGIEGAAYATTIAYIGSALFSLGYFAFGRSELTLSVENLVPDLSIIRETMSIGGITIARQAAISLLSVVLNQALFRYGAETGVAVWGIINRIMMFALFPVIGTMQGFMPIAGFNYGAQSWDRVKESIGVAFKYGSILSVGVFFGVMFGAEALTRVFTTDPELIAQTPRPMRFVFSLTPIIAVQLIGAAYFQAIGKVWPGLILTLSRQAFLLIPFILILPRWFDLDGVFFSFPLADGLSTLITYAYLRYHLKTLGVQKT